MRRLSVLLLLSWLALVTRPAQAVPIAYELQGVVSGGSWTTTGLGGAFVIPVGAAASLRWTVDSTALDQADNPTVGIFALAEPGGLGEGGLDVYGFHLQILGEGRFGATAPVMAIVDRGPTIPDLLDIEATLVEPPRDPPGPTCPGGAVTHSLRVHLALPLPSTSPAAFPPSVPGAGAT